MKRQKLVLEETKTKKLKERKGGGWINSEVGLRRDEAKRGENEKRGFTRGGGGRRCFWFDEMKKSIQRGGSQM